jgi:hypothetical protein
MIVNNNIKICLEYNIISNEIKFYTDLIDEDKYGTPEFVHYIYKLLSSDKWHKDLDKNLLYYEDYFLPEIQLWDIWVQISHIIKLILFLYSFENFNKNIIIYVSKNYEIEEFIIYILKIMNIKYEIVRVNEKTISHIPTYKEIRGKQYSGIKNSFKRISLFLINFYKKKTADAIYFQGYFSTKDLMGYLNENFVTDLKFKGFLSRNTARLFQYPTKCNRTFLFNNNTIIDLITLDNILLNLFKQIYLMNIYQIKCFINGITKKLKKMNIKNVILMHDLPFAHIIIAKYIKKNTGTVMLYQHGPREYSYLDNKYMLKNFDGIFCWSEYEKNMYKDINNKFKLVEAGYPYLYSLKGQKKERNSYELKDIVITILPPISLIEIVDRFNKEIHDLISIIKILLKLGVKKENIIIKIHPGHLNKVFFINILKDYLDENSIVKEESMISVVKRSDILIGPISTSAYESIFLNTPYVFFNKYSKFYTNHILNDIKIPTFEKVEELENILLDFKYPNLTALQEKMLYRYNYNETIEIIKNTFGVVN